MQDEKSIRKLLLLSWLV